jgi:hypothetical protein
MLIHQQLATRHAAGARESQEVREGCDGWRRPHPEQPLGGTDGCRTRQHGGSGLKSTTGACRGGSLAWVAEGGCYIKNQVRDPIDKKTLAFETAFQLKLKRRRVSTGCGLLQEYELTNAGYGSAEWGCWRALG